MRKSGLAFLAAVAAIVLAAYFLITDRLIERQIEKHTGRLVGAKVEIDRFQLSLRELSMGWDRLQVADPSDTWRNLVETEACEFDLNLEALLERKFVVNDFQALGVRTGTPRETDGSLPRSQRGSRSQFMERFDRAMEKARSRIPVLNPELLARELDIESIWDPALLKTPQLIGEARQEYGETLDRWESRIGDLPDQDDLRRIGEQIRAVDPEKIETPAQLRETLRTVNRIQEQVATARQQVDTLSESFSDDTAALNRFGDQVSAWMEEDLETVSSLAGLPDLSADHVAELLFGDMIMSRVEKVSRIVEAYRKVTDRFQGLPGKQVPPRGEGQDIAFTPRPEGGGYETSAGGRTTAEPGADKEQRDTGAPAPDLEPALPRFWIKNVALSGMYEGIDLTGGISHAVSNQLLINRPTTISAEAVRAGERLGFEALFDHRPQEPMDQLSFSTGGVQLNGISIGSSPLLPGEMTGGTGTLGSSFRFQGSDMTAAFSFQGEDIEFSGHGEPARGDDTTSLEFSGPQWVQLVREIYKGIDSISISARMSFTGDDVALSMESNLDRVIADQLKETFGRKVEQARAELRGRIHRAVEPAAAEAEEQLGTRHERIDSRISLVQTTLGEQADLLEQKKQAIERKLEQKASESRREAEQEVEQKIEEEQQETEQKIEEEVGDTLKNLLPSRRD